MALTNAPDLTQRPPRSPRVRLGGYVILPRMLDKGRALIAGKKGEYFFACPLDQRFLEFAGINPEALKKQLAAGKSDGEILAWIRKHAKNKPTQPESWPGPPSRTIERPPTPNHGSSSKARTPKSPPNATTSPLGSTCSTWTITSPSAASPEQLQTGCRRIALSLDCRRV